MSKLLGQIEETINGVQSQLTENDKAEVQEDYEYSRKKYKALLDAGERAMDMMLQMAEDSEHPKAFEVLTSILKTNAEITDKLLDLQKKRSDIQNKVKPVGGALDEASKNIFVGSTTELQRYLAGEDRI